MSSVAGNNSAFESGKFSLEQQIDDFIKSADGLNGSDKEPIFSSSSQPIDVDFLSTVPKSKVELLNPIRDKEKSKPTSVAEKSSIPFQLNTPTASLSDVSDNEEIVQRGAYADAKMRIGPEYQAAPPALIGAPGPTCRSPDRALCLWAPSTNGLSDAEVDEFVTVAKEQHGYTVEQALGLLHWHRHNLEVASADLPNFVPHPDEWTHEEKVVFEQAFSFQGKRFDKIAHALPDKSVQQLVNYYYAWKKTGSKNSMLERSRERQESGSECSDGELPEMRPGARRIRRPRRKSQSAGELQSATSDQQQQQHAASSRRRIPRGLSADYDSFVALAARGQAENAAAALEANQQLSDLKQRVQRNRQQLGQTWQSLLTDVSAYQEPDTEGQISYKWTDEELLLAVQGVRRYGKDFRAIAQLIGSKTENHVRYFYAQYRKKFGLDSVLNEFYKDSGRCSKQPA